MEDVTTFKSIQPQTEPIKEERLMEESGKVNDDSYEDSEPKPSELVKLGKLPLLLKLIENGEFAFEQFDVKPLSHEIDEFINLEIKRLHLKDDKETYQKILEKYLKDIKVEDIYSKIDLLVKKIRIDKKVLEAEQERKELLEADPLTLTSKKLMARFNLRSI